MEIYYLVVIVVLFVEFVYCIKLFSCYDLNMLISSFVLC